MTEQGRVDLERLRTVYERERAAVAHATTDQRDRTVRAQASIDRDTHMMGSLGPRTAAVAPHVNRHRA